MTTHDANTRILNMIAVMINKYPDIRFGQILVDLDIIQLSADVSGNIVAKDPYYDSSSTTLQRCLQVYEQKIK